MNLDLDDFALLGAPKTFAQDLNALRRAYLKLQAASHPDQFPLATPEEKRLALVWSSRINEAYTRLCNPVTRAQAWCALFNSENHEANKTTKPQTLPMQTMQQHMEWRETAEDAFNEHNQNALTDLLSIIEAQETHTLQLLEHCIDVQQDPSTAQEQITALQFITQLKGQLKHMLFALENP